MLPTILLSLLLLYLLRSLALHDAAWRAALERGDLRVDEQGHVRLRPLNPEP
jgi:hypothetical protein